MDRKPIQDRNAPKITEADKIARFYGFQPIIPPTIEKQDFEHVKGFDESSYPAEKAALLRMYFEDRMMSLPQPNMFYCERPFHGPKSLTGRKNPFRLEGALISLGSSKSVCECLSIQAGMAILKDIGHKNLIIEINSIGDKDSANEFQRKLTLFVRKNFNSFPAELRQAIKKNMFVVLKECRDEWQGFQLDCPKSIDFLSEASRSHFKEVLEFLEIMNIPYEINPHLLGDPDIGSETIFSIKDEKDGEQLAYGFRFNRLAKKIGCKKDLPCSVLNISAKLKKKLRKVKAKPIKPDFYLVQFGPEAKLKSFIILEELFKTGASVVHSIAKDKLGGQINTAEASEASRIILIGQKEALENSVVIRDAVTRAQQSVPIPELAAKVKELI
jgi:histidyl-tRNA synthetase